MANTVGVNIKKLREEMKLNQSNLANFLNVDQSLISKIENGERSLSIDMLEKLACLFGVTIDEMENENPKKETIHAVTVVPIFAPKITPMAWVRVRISALTKLTTMTVVAPDDWIIAVTAIPVITAANLLPVIFSRSFWRFLPAPFWIPFESIFIPKRRRQREPTKPNTWPKISRSIDYLQYIKGNNLD